MSTHYDAPPLENGLLAIECILLFGTLVQLGMVIASLPRIIGTRSGHLVPWFATVAALVFLTVAYALGIATVTVSNTVNAVEISSVSWQAWLRLSVAATLFTSWTEPFVFLAVALFLRDRYRAHAATRVQSYRLSTSQPLLPWVVSGILFALMVALPVAYEALFAEASTSIFGGVTSVNAIVGLINASNDLTYVYVGVYVLATIFLVGVAFVVKNLASTDRITRLILVVVVPLLSLRAISRLVFLIVNNRLSVRRSFIQEDLNIINLTSNLVHGLLYLLTTGILAYCLMVPQLWVWPREHSSLRETNEDSDVKVVDETQHAHTSRASPPH